jgi:hypothetical protein
MGMSRVVSRVRIAIAATLVTAGAAALFSTGALHSAYAGEPSGPVAAALPTPKDFVSNLDVECYDTPGPALNLTVALSHLNPVLLSLGLPAHNAIIRELVETCVPVMKNNVSPPSTSLPFIQYVDFACYRLETAALQVQPTINLRHLNPVLGTLPGHDVKMVQADELCLPVAKNNQLPPTTEILDLIRFLDLECYKVTEAQIHPDFAVTLRQLNPLLTSILPHTMRLTSSPRKLCVPVRKNQQVIPDASLNIIRWVDLERFPALQPIQINPVVLTLRHLNPLFSTLPQVQVVLQRAIALMVPVAKNGQTPP